MARSDFEDVASGLTPTPAKVYHCMPGAPRGDAIEPRNTYGAEIPATVQHALNISNEMERTPLVFAATHLSKSLPFAVPNGKFKIVNSAIPGTTEELLICCEGDRLLAQKLDATVFEIPGENFVTLPNAERQCVSKNAISFAEAKVVARFETVQDLMRAGLQIFTFREPLAKLYKDVPPGAFLFDKYMKENGRSFFLKPFVISFSVEN